MKFETTTNGCIKVTPEAGDPWKESLTAYGETTAAPNGQPAVNFGTAKIGGKIQTLWITTGNKPDLLAALEAVRPIQAEIAAKRKADEQARQMAADAYLASCPADCEPCKRLWANGDLCSAEYQAADGTKILDSDLIDGEYGIYFIAKADLDAQRGKNATERAERAASNLAKQTIRNKKAELSRTTGKPVKLESWTETRRVREGGEWGDYCFVVTRWINPDGTEKTSAINTY